MAPPYPGLCLLLLSTTTVVSSSNCLNPDTTQACSGSGICNVDACNCFPGYEGQWCETCKDCEEKVVAEECRKKETCMECERSPGCGWCSDSGQEIKTRCNSIEATQEICPSSSIERKFTGGPTTIVETRKQRFKGDWVQLQPQGVELVMNVGDTKYLDFTYMFINSGTTFSHNFPENIELEIYSTCGGKFRLKEVKGCHGILNGNTVQFHARFRLKSCPAKSSKWENSYKLTLSQGDALDIDFKAFCSCSCDQFVTSAICRNDKKTFLDINPCAKKDTCTDCLKDSACSWCSASKYSYFDGSPLPRCNNDNFFTSDLCPAEGKLDPPKALTASEDCSSCKHTCSGGICSERKQDLMDLNTCVSQLSCGDCMQADGCAWCPATDGAPKCNLVSNWVGKNEEGKNGGKFECQGALHGNISMMSSDKMEFFGNHGSYLNLYLKTDPKFDDNTVDIPMKVGGKYDLELTWNITAGRRRISPDFWKLKPKFDAVKLSMQSKNEKILSFLNLKYDYECSGRPCNSTDILSDMNEMVFKLSIELSECPDEDITEPIYLYLSRHTAEKYPYGVVRINVATFCNCDCEKKCSTCYEKLHSSCLGGTLKCGVCQECPDGSFGEFCQCTGDGNEKQPSQLKALPAVVIGNKDDLVGKSTKVLKDQFSFDHVIAPIGVPSDTLKCNATYCMNTNSRECYLLTEKNRKFDLARATNLFAIYGDHRLLPGAELIFKITYCPLKLSIWGTHETRFGFGTPPSKKNDYNLPQKESFDMLRFWSDDSYTWAVEDLERSDGSLQSMDYEYGAWFSGEYNDGRKWTSFETRVPEGIESIGYVSQKIDSDVKLVVTETEVIWSWEGFKSPRQPEITELRQKINMNEKEYFPLFMIPGCETDGDFSSVKIISSKVGKA
eukprot:GFUD01066297.1.p1 GENE.GFUD01066297.1~~GFUD01066297.1.p1  ORF type:complete len:898 (+),score=162.35 GFUD01066297.1:62-2755(+)